MFQVAINSYIGISVGTMRRSLGEQALGGAILVSGYSLQAAPGADKAPRPD